MPSSMWGLSCLTWLNPGPLSWRCGAWTTGLPGELPGNKLLILAWVNLFWSLETGSTEGSGHQYLQERVWMWTPWGRDINTGTKCIPTKINERAISKIGCRLFKPELDTVSPFRCLVSWLLSLCTQLNIHFEVGPGLWSAGNTVAENCRDLIS